MKKILVLFLISSSLVFGVEKMLVEQERSVEEKLQVEMLKKEDVSLKHPCDRVQWEHLSEHEDPEKLRIFLRRLIRERKLIKMSNVKSYEKAKQSE